jgi:hypothetical protein
MNTAFKSRFRKRSCLKGKPHSSRGQRPGIAEEKFFQIHKNIGVKSCRLSLAGRIRTFRNQSIPLSCRSTIYFRSGRASQETNVSRRTSGYSQEIRRGIRRTLFVGLRESWIALSGRHASFLHSPRALPSAKMVQAFGLHSSYCGFSEDHGGSRLSTSLRYLWSFLSLQICSS